MARVPDYSLPAETERALPGVRVESIASPALLDAGAEANIALGKSVQAAGTGLEQVAYHMAQRENADVLFRNESEDKAAYLAYEADLRQNRQGNAAKGAASDTAAWWKERISKNVEGMTREQQRLYAHRIMPVQLQSIHSVSQFEGHQLEVAHDQSWTADKHNTINLGAANPNPGVIGTSIAEIKKFNSYQAARKGWAPEVLQAVNGDDITKLHKQAIQTIVAKDPAAATAYFKEHESEINGTDRAEIGQFAEKATATAIGVAGAQSEWTLNGPKGDTDASNLDKMETAIRDKYKDNIPARDAALRELEHIDTVRDKSIKARDDKGKAAVNTLLMEGKTIAQIQREQPALWASIKDPRAVVLHEESIAATRDSRAASRAGRLAAEDSRAYTAEVRAEHRLHIGGIDTANALADPTRLMALSRDEVVNLRPALGDQSTKELLNKWDAFTKNGTHLTEAKIDADQFAKFARRAGLDPEATVAKDKDMAVRVKDTRDSVEKIIAIEQQTKKRPLTRDEKDVILQKQIDDSVMQHNSFLFDKSVPAIALPSDKQATAYVVVGGQEVKLSSIPATDRADIIRARKAAGLPITEKAIAEMWVKKNAAQRREPIHWEQGVALDSERRLVEPGTLTTERMERLTEAVQRKAGRPLTPEEQEDIVRGQRANLVILPAYSEFLHNREPWGDVAVPALSLTKEEMKGEKPGEGAFVEVAGPNFETVPIQLSEIPRKERIRIIREAGRLLTEKEIAQKWFDGVQKIMKTQEDIKKATRDAAAAKSKARDTRTPYEETILPAAGN